MRSRCVRWTGFSRAVPAERGVYVAVRAMLMLVCAGGLLGGNGMTNFDSGIFHVYSCGSVLQSGGVLSAQPCWWS
jgi:hypothetical protein